MWYISESIKLKEEFIPLFFFCNIKSKTKEPSIHIPFTPLHSVSGLQETE